MIYYVLGTTYLALFMGLGVLGFAYLNLRQQLTIARGDAGLAIFQADWWSPEVTDETLPLSSRTLTGRHRADNPDRQLVDPTWMPLIGARLQSAWANPGDSTTYGYVTVNDLQQLWSEQTTDYPPVSWFKVQPRESDLVGTHVG